MNKPENHIGAILVITFILFMMLAFSCGYSSGKKDGIEQGKIEAIRILEAGNR